MRLCLQSVTDLLLLYQVEAVQAGFKEMDRTTELLAEHDRRISFITAQSEKDRQDTSNRLASIDKKLLLLGFAIVIINPQALTLLGDLLRML